MLHELRTYTARPGSIPKILELNEKVGRKVRGNDYGVLEGYWYTEMGPLNQVMHLWRFDSFEERARLRDALGKLEGWTKEYVPNLRPLLVNQQTRFLNPAKDLTPSDGEHAFYEFRNYRVNAGAAKAWMGLFTNILPVREKYSKNVGAWITEGPNPNEVCHLWAYKSLDERTEARAKCAADPDWQKFVKAGGEHLVEMHSTMLIPASFSPLK